MTKLQEIKRIQKQIKALTKTITKIENSCPHARLTVRHFPDWNCGQGGDVHCTDCGKFISCWTMTPLTEDGKPVKKTRIVKNVGTAKNPKFPETHKV